MVLSKLKEGYVSLRNLAGEVLIANEFICNVLVFHTLMLSGVWVVTGRVVVVLFVLSTVVCLTSWPIL